MLCGPPIGCGCAFESDGLVISVGAAGQIILEPAGPGIVALKADVTSPFLGQSIVETSTGRLYWYDGTNWVIFGGRWPSVNVTRSATLSIPDAGAGSTDVTLLDEVYDTDAFHTASSAAYVVPAGLGGKYSLAAGMRFAASSAGYRASFVVITANASSTSELGTLLGGGSGMQLENTANNALGHAKDLLLEPGATLTLGAYQTSGGPLNVTSAFMTLRMTEHLPALT